jgi:hypothetical protein
MIEKFDVELVLDRQLNHSIEGQVTHDIRIVKYNFDNRLHSAIVTVDAEEYDHAVSKAIKKLENFLNIYFLYSFEARGINPSTQIDLKNLSTGQIRSSIGSRVVLGKGFKKETLDEINSNYLDDIPKKHNEYLRIAMDYFRRGRMEHYDDNRIIDYFVSLEALYSKDEERTEMRYRFSNRIATLLGKDIEDRLEMKEKARSLYDKRSALVHGSVTKLEDKEQGILFRWIRESILRFMSLSKFYLDHKTIINKIDDAMIDNSIRDKLRIKSEDLLKKVMI